jgi:hypothetical protein
MNLVKCKIKQGASRNWIENTLLFYYKAHIESIKKV